MLKSLLSSHEGKIYVYLANEEICKQFFQDAENEGFLFADGTKPTKKKTSDIIAINKDLTVNYVGLVGRLAFQSADKIGDEPLIKIDYQEILKQSK